MNASNFRVDRYKCLIQHGNVDDIKEFITKAEAYIRTLKHFNGQYP